MITITFSDGISFLIFFNKAALMINIFTSFTKRLYKSFMIFITNMPDYDVSIRKHIAMKPIRYENCTALDRNAKPSK